MPPIIRQHSAKTKSAIAVTGVSLVCAAVIAAITGAAGWAWVEYGEFVTESINRLSFILARVVWGMANSVG